MNVTVFLDPGGDTGYSTWNDDLGKCIDYGEVKGLDKLAELLIMVASECNIVKIIYEAYRIFPKDEERRAGYSVHERKGHEVTLKAVGAIEMFCLIHKIPYETQELSARDAGYKQSGLAKAKSHSDSHWRDAVAHGTNYYVRKGKYKVKRLSLQQLKRKSGED